MNRLTLGEIADKSGGFIQTGPFGSQLHSYDYVDAGIPVVMPQDIVSNRIDLSKISYIEPSLANTLKRHYLRNGDIVFPRRGDISKCAIFDDDSRLMFCGTGCLKISIPEIIVNPKWLFYYLLQDEIIKYIENNAVGSTMLNLNTGILKSVEIQFPEIEVQKKIASILSNYDDLIQTNQQRIALLEEAAQRLYDEWFVKLRFPNHEQVPVVDGVPDGWVKGSVGDLASVSSGFAFKSSDWLDYGNPVIKIKNITMDYQVDVTSCHCVDDSVAEFASRFEVFSGDLLIAMTGATVGKVGIFPPTEKRFYLNQRVGKFFPKKQSQHIIFLFFLSMTEFFQNHINNLAGGSAQPNISGGQIESIPVLISSDDIMSSFMQIVRPLFEQRQILTAQNQKLIEARDELLPRLMSGKLDVSKLTLAKVA